MAATIATAIGIDKSGSTKEATRLGSHSSIGKAATYRTFAEVGVNADGSGYVVVRRDDKTIVFMDFAAE